MDGDLRTLHAPETAAEVVDEGCRRARGCGQIDIVWSKTCVDTDDKRVAIRRTVDDPDRTSSLRRPWREAPSSWPTVRGRQDFQFAFDQALSASPLRTSKSIDLVVRKPARLVTLLPDYPVPELWLKALVPHNRMKKAGVCGGSRSACSRCRPGRNDATAGAEHQPMEMQRQQEPPILTPPGRRQARSCWRRLHPPVSEFGGAWSR